MSNLESKHVKIFPFGSPRDSDSYARILDEFNIRRIMKSIVDKPSYVISVNNDYSCVEFVIEGYYFNVNLTSVLEDTSTFGNKPIYASIQLNPDNSHEYIVGGDTDGVFTGIRFSTQAEITENHYSLQLLTANRVVPADSLIKFKMESFENTLDLSNYVTTSELQTELTSYYTQQETQNAIKQIAYTKQQVNNEIANAIADISTIYCGTSEDLID